MGGQSWGKCGRRGFQRVGKGNNYNQFYQNRMLSQIYLIVDANTLGVDAAFASPSQQSLLFLEEIQKALSVSLNLYAISQQESKVRTLTHPLPPAQLPPPPSTTPPIASPPPNNSILPHYKNVSERKNSSSSGDYFCKTHHESPRQASAEEERHTDRCDWWLEGEGRAAGREIKIKRIGSHRRNKNRLRFAFRKERPVQKANRTTLRDCSVIPVGTAIIGGALTGRVIKEKREELMRRWVRSWNPHKDEAYIKNREFRMLLRN